MEPFVPAAAENGAELHLLSGWMDRYPGLVAGVTGRGGGFSGGHWSSLNMGLHVGDDPRTVIRNRMLVADSIGWPFEAWTCGEQVHGDRVYRVTAADRGRGRDSRETAIPDTDALMTNEKGVLLASFYADCVPLLFHDPVRGAVALAHAGWKGTVLEIAARTVESMNAAFGTRPEELVAAIGPAIGACCYEVDEPVIARVAPLAESLAAATGASADLMIVPSGDGRARLNLKEINRQIMIKAGIVPSRIECTERCTGCSRALFYSHRMESGRTGRLASLIGMG